MIHAISESNQNWYVNYHKRNHNGINRLITGSVGLVQSFVIFNWGQTKLIDIQRNHYLNSFQNELLTEFSHTNSTKITYVDLSLTNSF
jgi:hypothetical protein